MKTVEAVGIMRAGCTWASHRKGVRVAGAGLASILSYQAATDLEKPDASLQLQNMGEEWSHKFLLQQSSVLNVESASVTLTQTVVAIQTCARSYCTHLTQLTSLLAIANDGLPIAYTSEEVYEKVVQLRAIIKKEKATLIELGVLFTYIKKLMDSVAETAFLVGAEYASLQAASRLSSAELQIKQELDMADIAERYLLLAEKENVVKVGKEEKAVAKLDADFVKEEIKKFDEKENVETPSFEEIKVTVTDSNASIDDEKSVKDELFSFDKNGDDQIKISVHETDPYDDIKITVKVEEEEDNCEKEEKIDYPEIPRYKMPTF